ncbi:MAG TPA: hypothetical protein VMN57_07150 [Anaerolineales bacterium]|nr:hypothetical protein [Anaerolineales bacterium]
MRVQRLLIVFSILALGALACNLGAAGVSPVETSSPGQPPDSSGGSDPGEGDTPDGGSEDDGGNVPGNVPDQPPAAIDLDDPALYAQPDLFNSYRTSMDYTFVGQGPITGTILIDSATQVDPYATTLEFFTFGNAVTGGEGVYTFTQILDTQYAVAPGYGCRSGSAGLQANPFEVMLDTGGMLMGEAQFAGEDDVNGVDTYVYTITMDNIDPLNVAGKDVRELTNGLVHIARAGGYAVRVVLEGRGVNELLSQDPNLDGDVYYELNFYDFDAPVTIEVPPACDAVPGGNVMAIPIMEDATGLVLIGNGILSYHTGGSIGDVIEFYEEAMPARGCGAPIVSGDSGSATMSFPGCDGGEVSVIIAAQSGDVTQVTLLQAP